MEGNRGDAKVVRAGLFGNNDGKRADLVRSCSDKKTKNKNRKDADEVVWANVEKRVCRKKKESLGWVVVVWCVCGGGRGEKQAAAKGKTGSIARAMLNPTMVGSNLGGALPLLLSFCLGKGGGKVGKERYREEKTMDGKVSVGCGMRGAVGHTHSHSHAERESGQGELSVCVVTGWANLVMDHGWTTAVSPA